MTDGSGGIVASSAYSRPLRRSTAAHRPSASSAEDLLAPGRLDDPRLLLELALELARAPAGVAGVDARAAHAAGDVADLARLAADEAEVVVEQHAGEPGLVELGEHDHGVGGDRAAEVDGRAVVGELGEVRHDVDHQRLGGPVEHEAHRALVGVLRDQDHRAVEVGIDQGR